MYFGVFQLSWIIWKSGEIKVSYSLTTWNPAEMQVHLKIEKLPTPSLPGRPLACRPGFLGALHHGLHHVPLLPHLHCPLQGRHENLCHPLQSVIFPENSQISKKCMQQPLRSFSKAHIIAFQSATKLKIEPNRLVS